MLPCVFLIMTEVEAEEAEKVLWHSECICFNQLRLYQDLARTRECQYWNIWLHIKPKQYPPFYPQRRTMPPFLSINTNQKATEFKSWYLSRDAIEPLIVASQSVLYFYLTDVTQSSLDSLLLHDLVSNLWHSLGVFIQTSNCLSTDYYLG